MSEIDWSKAPEGAEFYARGQFRKIVEGRKLPFVWDFVCWSSGYQTLDECKESKDYCERPKEQHSEPVISDEPENKYRRQILGLDGKTCLIDVYRVLDAFEVDSHPLAHSIKKLLVPGKRHAKTREQDLREAIASIEAELLLMEQRK